MHPLYHDCCGCLHTAAILAQHVNLTQDVSGITLLLAWWRIEMVISQLSLDPLLSVLGLPGWIESEPSVFECHGIEYKDSYPQLHHVSNDAFLC